MHFGSEDLNAEMYDAKIRFECVKICIIKEETIKSVLERRVLF